MMKPERRRRGVIANDPEEGLRKTAAGQRQIHGRELLDTFRRRQNRMRMRQGARLDGTKSPTLVLEKVYILP